MRRIRLLATLTTLTLLAAPARADERLRVHATLIELPTAPATCERKVVRVVARYRLERVLAGKSPCSRPSDASRSGATAPGCSFFVAQRCPELARAPTGRQGRGTAPRLRPGHVHLLDLRPYEGSVDAAPEGLKLDQVTLREAVRTDLAPEPPRIAVVLEGNAGAKHRLDFDADQVTVGRAPESDVLLSHPAVGLRQLLLQIKDEVVVVRDLRGGAKLNGAPLRGARAITYKDALSVGPYTLHVSLLEPLAPASE